jgi:transcriptional regulator with XRE-family HTH domain
VSSPFGSHLRRWRRHRGLSQLALAAAVASTPRHVSFLETGRSRPSRAMVLRLCDALQVPMRDRNPLLHAAGLPSAYPQSDLADPDLAPYRSIIDLMLRTHQPYPAMVVDRLWNVVAANAAALGLFGSDLVGANVVHHYLTSPAAREAIVNWPEVAWAGLARLRQQANLAPFDDDLRALVAQAERALAGLPPPATEAGLTLCPAFRVGDQVIRTIGVVARFEPVAEVSVGELRIELTYPMDEVAERFFRRQF